MQEKDYVANYCDGRQEFVLSDKTRVDCLTETHAIEYDFAHKWYEAIGQSLHYAKQTGLRAGIVLIVANSDDDIQVQRAAETISYYHLPIDLWKITDY